MDPSVVAVSVLGGLVVMRWIVIALGAALLVHPVRDCPACFGDTVAVRRPWLGILGRWYEWRWCPRCDWQGIARRLRSRPGPTDDRHRTGSPAHRAGAGRAHRLLDGP